MKINSLIYICLALSVSEQAIAGWQFNGQGRVIEEHQTISPGVIKGGLIDEPTLSTAHHVGASAYASAYSATGYVNSLFSVNGKHSVDITNNTNYTQRYRYTYDLCADRTKCFNYSGTIELEPRSSGQNNASSYVTVQFTQPGTYTNEAKTQISGEQNTSKSDQASINIYK